MVATGWLKNWGARHDPNGIDTKTEWSPELENGIFRDENKTSVTRSRTALPGRRKQTQLECGLQKPQHLTSAAQRLSGSVVRRFGGSAPTATATAAATAAFCGR